MDADQPLCGIDWGEDPVLRKKILCRERGGFSPARDVGSGSPVATVVAKAEAPLRNSSAIRRRLSITLACGRPGVGLRRGDRPELTHEPVEPLAPNVGSCCAVQPARLQVMPGTPDIAGRPAASVSVSSWSERVFADHNGCVSGPERSWSRVPCQRPRKEWGASSVQDLELLQT